MTSTKTHTNDVAFLSKVLQQNAPVCRSQPQFFSVQIESDRSAMAELLRTQRPPTVHDTIAEQLCELMEIRNPSESLSDQELLERARCHAGSDIDWSYGTWVYFSWSNTLVHLLNKEDFSELRASRNRNKITSQEQTLLRQKKIGIVGLSVGNIIALTMAMEGVGGAFHLADYDYLSLSNTNRVLSGVDKIGAHKAHLCAQRMFEIDPYLDITVFDDGLTESNRHEFFGDSARLDLLVEECDSLPMKIRIREHARSLGIPVLMETNDRGLLDVERFDLEPSRPVFHGLVEDTTADKLEKTTNPADKLPFIIRLLGGEERLSPRSAASLFEIDHTLISWPQLSSDTILGGSVVTSTARRILLNEMRESGRYYVDVAKIVADGEAEDLEPLRKAAFENRAPLETDTRALRMDSYATTSDVPSGEEVEELVRLGAMAPSGGNIQPWRFRWTDAALECHVDLSRADTLLDGHLHSASLAAIGAAVENITLAAQGLGYRTVVDYADEPGAEGLACKLSFSRESGLDVPALLPFVPTRATNRHRESRTELPANKLQRLARVAEEAGASLHVLTAEDSLKNAAKVLAGVNRMQMYSKQLHSEMMNEIRWTQEEAQETRDGLDVATLEASLADLTALKLLSTWRVVSMIRRTGTGGGLDRLMNQWVAGASALCLVTLPKWSPRAFVEGGRVMQRVWLQATADEIAVQPLSSAPYLFARMERGGAEGLSKEDGALLRPLREQYLQLFGLNGSEAEILLFRVFAGSPPTARALRRPVPDILEFG